MEAVSWKGTEEIMQEKHNTQDKREAYEQSLAIGKKTLHDMHPDLAAFFANIGTIHKNLGDMQKAKGNWLKAAVVYDRFRLPLVDFLRCRFSLSLLECMPQVSEGMVKKGSRGQWRE